MQSIREKIKRRFSHKDQNVNFDEHDEADEETSTYLQKEIESAETDEKNPQGKPGSLLNRMIMHGNKKTEDELARDVAEYQARQQQVGAVGAAGTTTS